MAKKFIHNVYNPQVACEWTYQGSDESEVVDAATDHVVMEEVSLLDTPELRKSIKDSLIDVPD